MCRGVAHSEVRRLAVERVVEGLEILLVAPAAFPLGGVTRRVGRRIGDHVRRVAVDADRALLVVLPGEAMRAVLFPVLEQDLVAGATHLGRILVRRRGPALVHLHDAMIAMAVAAAGRRNEAGQKQRLAVLTGQAVLDQFGRIVVATATVLDLVDRRNRRSEVIRRPDIVRSAVAVGARRLAAMCAAAQRAQYGRMAFGTGRLVRQGFDAALVAAVGYVRMAFATGNVRVGRRGKLDVIVALEAIQVLGIGRERNQDERRQDHERGSGDTCTHAHFLSSAESWCA